MPYLDLPCLHIKSHVFSFLVLQWVTGWSGGALVLGKLLVLGRPTDLDYGRARAY